MELREGDVAKNKKYTVLPRGGLVHFDRQDHFKSQNVLGCPAGGPYILIFGHVPLPQFHIA